MNPIALKYRIFLSLLLILIVGVFLESYSYFDVTKNRLQSKSVPAQILNQGILGEKLRALGVLHVQPNTEKKFAIQRRNPLLERRQIYDPKLQVGQQLLGIERVGAYTLPSTTILPLKEQKKQIPTISLTLDRNDLINPYIGLLSQPNHRGRDWERGGYISYFDNGQLLYASGVGVRIHGGGSRQRKLFKSFRLNFRKVYGDNPFPVSEVFGSDVKDQPELVLKYYERIFAESIYLDLAEPLGIKSFPKKMVRFFLNGKPYGVYLLQVPLSVPNMTQYVGHENFVHVRTRDDVVLHGEESYYQNFRSWLQTTNPTYQEISSRIDMRQFMAWFLLSLVTYNIDPLQGAALLDLNKEPPKWNWVLWDLDAAFFPKTLSKDLVEQMVAHPERVRGLMLRKLMKDPHFLSEFLSYKQTVFNHVWTKEKIKDMSVKYRLENKHYELPKKMWKGYFSFLKNRAVVIESLMQRHFSPPGIPKKVLIHVKKSIPYWVDGIKKNGTYEGAYYAGTKLELKIGSQGKEKFLGWRISNRPQLLANKVLNLTISTTTQIEAVFSSENLS